jgi:hypothetical protein
MHDTSKEIEQINETLITANCKEVISYLQGKALLQREAVCAMCGQTMSLNSYKKLNIYTGCGVHHVL